MTIGERHVRTGKRLPARNGGHRALAVAVPDPKHATAPAARRARVCAEPVDGGDYARCGSLDWLGLTATAAGCAEAVLALPPSTCSHDFFSWANHGDGNCKCAPPRSRCVEGDGLERGAKVVSLYRVANASADGQCSHETAVQCGPVAAFANGVHPHLPSEIVRLEAEVLTPKNWGPHYSTCPSYIGREAGGFEHRRCENGCSPPCSYFAERHQGRRTSDSGLRALLGQCAGGIFWSRSDDVAAFAGRTEPYVLISGGLDQAQPGRLWDVLSSDSLCGWYVQNYDGSAHPKVFPIPIGFDLHTVGKPGFGWYVSLRRSPQPTRKLAVLVDHMSPTNPTRQLAMETVAGCARVPHTQLPKMCINLLHQEYRSYAFGLSPPGNGVDCHRTWEMLYFGMIPIMLHSSIDPLFDGLPVVLLDKWEDLCDLDLAAVSARLKPLLPVPERIFTMQHWFERYRHNHTCQVDLGSTSSEKRASREPIECGITKSWPAGGVLQGSADVGLG